MAHALPTDVLANCDGFLYCLSLWANDVTQGLMFPGLLFAFAMVLFMGTVNNFGTPRAYGFASVSALLGSLWLFTMQLMPWWFASLFILNGVAGFVVMIISEK